MSFYHTLADPLTKESMQIAKTVGRSLLNRGTWGTVGRVGEKLADKGGRVGSFGKGLTTTATGIGKASPWLLGYGMTGLYGDLTGKFDLPGSNLAFNLSTPMIGAAMSAGPLIQSMRLSGGKYDARIKEDAQQGARQAGSDWITATQRNGQAAYDPAAYQRLLQENNVDTSAADRYLNREPVQRPSWWRRFGNAFENPTGNVLPEVQQGIYDQLNKGASVEMEKEAMMAAARGAWRLSRGVGQEVARGSGFAKGPLGGELGNFLRSGRRAGMAGLRASAPANWMRAHPNAGKYAERGLNTAFIGLGGWGAYDALTSDKPYDEQAVMQEGYDGAQAGIRKGLAGMTAFERSMARMDPSLAVSRMEGKLPGSIANWERQNGQAYQPGFMGSLSQIGQAIGGSVGGAWNNRGTPGFYSYDSAGNTNYL
jgi:hypothetical protein